jgi:hypothetical protein
MFKRSKPTLSRIHALDAKPIAVKIHSREPLPDGGERITVRIDAPKFARMVLRIKGPIKRNFEFDAIGMDVLGMCDGQKTVRYIISRFAKRHNLNQHEAERAVTTFLRTLTQKGVVALLAPNE